MEQKIMWRSFEDGNEVFIIKIWFEQNNFRIFLSNMKYLWIEENSLENALIRFKANNPILNITEQGLKEQMMAIIDNIDKYSGIKIEDSNKSECISLTIHSKFNTISIEMMFSLEKSSPEIFFSEVTSNLVKTVVFLENKNKMMLNLLKKKDRELQEYKLEKGNITRNDLITEPFQESANEDNSIMLNIYNGVFWDKFRNKTECVELDVIPSETIVDRKSVKRKIYSAKTLKK